MAWFQNFVDETTKAWGKRGRRRTGDEAIDRFLELAGLTEASSRDKGDIGEKHVADLLNHKGYEACLSPGSRTPADVWGIRSYADFVHVVLLQVKTAQDQDQPQKLTNAEIAELGKMAKFVYDAIQASGLVPEKIQSRNCFVSTGYAGVQLDADDVPEVFDASNEGYPAWYSPGLDNRYGTLPTRTENLVDDAYSLRT